MTKTHSLHFRSLLFTERGKQCSIMQIDCDKGYTLNAIKFAYLTNWQKWGISSYFSFKNQTYKMLLHAFNKIQSFYKIHIIDMYPYK